MADKQAEKTYANHGSSYTISLQVLINRIIGKVDAMRYATALVIGFGFLMCGCTSREVTRVTSPNGRLEAVVFESLGGAIDDVDDEVWVVPKGSHSGAHVASFDDAIKGEHSWGVNVKWDSANHLVIEYLRAGQANLLIRKTVIAGQDIQVTLRGGPQDGPCAQPCPD